MKHDVGCSTLGWHFYNLDEALTGIESLQFQYIDIAMIPGICSHFDPVLATPAEKEALKKRVRDAKFRVATLNTFKGYLGGKPEAFDGEGYFHTGDLFVVDSEGDYTFVGRTKDMIKTGGENVYSSEVEEAINSLPYVSESAVIGVPDKSWGEIVAAVVVLKPGASTDEEKLRNDLKQKLSSFKVPKRAVFVSALPKSELGKVQKYLVKELYDKSVH